MKRLAIALALVTACSGKGKSGTTTAGSGSGSGPAVYAKKLGLGWGFSPKGGTTDVFLQTTDETGAQVSYPLGSYPGECKTITAAPEMKAVSAVACTSGTTGSELDAVVTGEEIIILKMHLDSGVKADPMTREEVTRIKAAGGAKIEAGT